MIPEDHNYHILVPFVPDDVFNQTMRNFSETMIHLSVKVTDMLVWLNLNVEHEGFSYRILGKEIDVWFKYEKDLTAFALKYGGRKA